WYVAESDPEEDPKEYEDDETEDAPVDYPMDEGDDGDDDDGDSSEDDADDEDEDEEEEEEHPAVADSAIVIPNIELVFPPEGTEPAEVERLLAIPTPPPSPPISLSPPSVGERLARCMASSAYSSPPHVPSPLLPSPGEVGYSIRDTWVDPAEAVPEIAPMTVGEDSRTRISQRVTVDSQRVNLLMGDRMTLSEIVLIVEEEAYSSREAWAHLIGLSQAVYHELQTHRDHVYAHETQIQAHQTHLQLQGTLIQTQHQAELLAMREQQRRARQPGPDVRVPDHQDASRDVDSHI
ncbi:hypothetical protein Tco_1341803, partial [Tanacetum coccineum]